MSANKRTVPDDNRSRLCQGIILKRCSLSRYERMEVGIINDSIATNRDVVANGNCVMRNQRRTTHAHAVANLNASAQVSNEKTGLLSADAIMISAIIDIE